MATTTTFFNPNIRPALIEALESAENELIIAVCWFNDTALLDVLIQALTTKPQLKIKIAVSDEPENISLDSLVDAAPERVDFYPIPVGEKFPNFCIIDKKMVLSGAFNWSVDKVSELLSITQGRGASAAVKTFTAQFVQIIQSTQKVLSENLAKLADVTAEAQKLVSTRATLIETYLKKYKKFPTQEFITQIFTSGETVLSIFANNLPVVANNALVVEEEKEVEEEVQILMPEEIYDTPEKRKAWWDGLSLYGNLCLNWQIFKQNHHLYIDDNAILNIFHQKIIHVYDENKNQCNNFSFLNKLTRLAAIYIHEHKPSSGLSTLDIKNLPNLCSIGVDFYFDQLKFDQKRLEELGFEFKGYQFGNALKYFFSKTKK